jgi:hypothetical protein
VVGPTSSDCVAAAAASLSPAAAGLGQEAARARSCRRPSAPMDGVVVVAANASVADAVDSTAAAVVVVVDDGLMELTVRRCCDDPAGRFAEGL